MCNENFGGKKEVETEVTKTETWKLLWQQSLNTQHHNICMDVTHEKKEKRYFFLLIYIFFWYGRHSISS